jgi:hypothetical protein
MMALWQEAAENDSRPPDAGCAMVLLSASLPTQVPVRQELSRWLA